MRWPTGWPGSSPAPGSKGLIAAVHSADDPVVGEKLTSRPGRHGQATLVLLELRTEFMAVENMGLLDHVERRLEEIRRGADFPKGLKLGITGSAAVGADMLSSAEESIRNTEWTTVALVVLILLVVYLRAGLVIVPLVAIFASLELSTGLIALLARLGQNVDWFDFKVFHTTKIFIVVVLDAPRPTIACSSSRAIARRCSAGCRRRGAAQRRWPASAAP